MKAGRQDDGSVAQAATEQSMSAYPTFEEAKRDQAARALDLTLAYDGRGPRTYVTRRRVAAALDGQASLRASDIFWLERIARIGGQS